VAAQSVATAVFSRLRCGGVAALRKNNLWNSPPQETRHNIFFIIIWTNKLYCLSIRGSVGGLLQMFFRSAAAPPRRRRGVREVAVIGFCGGVADNATNGTVGQKIVR